MIGTSISEYIFIRACIFFLHRVVPFGSLCYALFFIVRPQKNLALIILEIWAVSEILFYLLIFLPRRYLLQRPAVHLPAASRQKREELFDLSHQTIKDYEQYLRKWFRDAPLSEIQRDNLKDFYCWAFLNKGTYGLLDDEELEQYVDKFEAYSGIHLDSGRGRAVPLRLTIDRVNMLYRPLLWYLAVSVVDNITHVYMLFYSFRFYRLPIKHFFTVFPLRPLTLLSLQKSPAATLTYWYRPHKSKKKLPVLFIHGIGIGMYTYINFLTQINRPDTVLPNEQFEGLPTEDENDGEVGIIAIELMPISFRITSAMPSSKQLVTEIYQILKHHGWEKIVLISHSYGSVVATHLLKSELTASMIGPSMFVDPVSLLLHLPEVAYNFTIRKPREANEHQLYYFASSDMGVSHTLHRRFHWSECVLFKTDMACKDWSVICVGLDLIVRTAAVAKYLLEDDKTPPGDEGFKKRKWTGKGLDLLWFDDLDHAQVFDTKQNCSVLAKVVRQYSLGGAVKRTEENGVL